MENTFNSNNELWTEIALSGGWIEVLAGAANLSVGEADKLTAIKVFSVANSYMRRRHTEQFLKILGEMLLRFPGTTD